MKKVSLLFICAILISSAGVYASGLAIPEQGAAAMGMSAAMTARSEDLSALYYNPSGLDYVEKTEFLLGITPIKPVHKFSDESVSVGAEKMTFVPPNVYYAHRVHERVVFGLGLYTPYGLGTDWNENWAGRYTSTYGEIRSLYFTPAVSVKISRMLSIGASFSWIWSDAIIKKKIDSGLAIYGAYAGANPAAANPMMVANPGYDSEFSLNGDGGGVSYTLGLMFRPFESMQMGLTYTGETELTYKGTAKFTHTAENLLHPSNRLDSLITSQFPYTQKGNAVLNLPSSFNFGLKYDLTPKWDAEVDLNFVNWSSYDKLVIDLKQDLPKDELVQEKKWKDSTVIRLGTSYDLNEGTTLRLGFLSDKSPVPNDTFDAQLPDGDRIGLSLGVGRTITVGSVPLKLDVSYMYLKFSDRDKDNYVGYQDVGSFDSETGLPKGVKDGVIDAADKAILDNMMTLMGRGSYPVGNGAYESHVNLFSASVTYRF